MIIAFNSSYGSCYQGDDLYIKLHISLVTNDLHVEAKS